MKMQTQPYLTFTKIYIKKFLREKKIIKESMTYLSTESVIYADSMLVQVYIWK
jgi:hypothetical protein